MGKRRVIPAIALTMVLPVLAAAAQAPGLVTAKHGMAVSSERRASDVGVSILKAGGNAVDSAVALASRSP